MRATPLSFYDANVRDHDPVEHAPRFLHLVVARGYATDVYHVYHSVREEPECVTESEQRALTDDAHRRDRARKVAAFAEARSAIDGALDAYVSTVGASAGSELFARVRAVRRSVDRLSEAV